jgi:hypothetical protein
VPVGDQRNSWTKALWWKRPGVVDLNADPAVPEKMRDHETGLSIRWRDLTYVNTEPFDERGWGDPFYDDYDAAVRAIEEDVAEQGRITTLQLYLRIYNEITWDDFWAAAKRGAKRRS